MIVVFDLDLVLDNVTPVFLEKIREASRSHVIIFTTSRKFKEVEEKVLDRCRMPTKALFFVLAEGGRHCLGVRYIETKCLWKDEDGDLKRLFDLRGFDKKDVISL